MPHSGRTCEIRDAQSAIQARVQRASAERSGEACARNAAQFFRVRALFSVAKGKSLSGIAARCWWCSVGVPTRHSLLAK
jgi:hypothetical protein